MSTATSGARRLKELERDLRSYDAGAAERKRACLDELARARLASAAQVLRLHEALCFLRAYPDDHEVLARAESMLAGFARRADLRRRRKELADSGVAGTDIHFPFFQPQATWLAERYGAGLSIDWKAYETKERLRGWLEALVLESEVPALYDLPRSVEGWLATLKGPDETDAQYLLRRLGQLDVPDSARRSLHDGLDLPYRVDGRVGGPTRTPARHRGSPVHLQDGPLRRERPDLAQAVRVAPLAVRDCAPAEAEALIELARDAMATRSRDLDSFSYASPADVRMVELGEGLQLAWMGLVPAQRIVLEGLYAFLILKSGVPTGYALASAPPSSAGARWSRCCPASRRGARRSAPPWPRSPAPRAPRARRSTSSASTATPS
jgi:hypothetical protein